MTQADSNTADISKADGYTIAVFAHNEEKNICKTLDSIINNSDDNLYGIYVLANGCTDNTASVARGYFAEKGFTKHHIIEIEIGDKCNAWNEYVYTHRPKVKHHFFVDSDVTFSKDAFKILHEGFTSEFHHVMAGLPLTGRNKRKYFELATKYGCLFGNLYCVKHTFLDRVQAEGIKLPLGLCWIDAQLTKLVNEDLRGERDDYQRRVTCIKGVGYEFESLRPWRIADIKLWTSRIARYKAGQLQEPYLDAVAFHEWPNTLNDINSTILTNVCENKIRIPFYLKNKIVKKLSKGL